MEWKYIHGDDDTNNYVLQSLDGRFLLTRNMRGISNWITFVIDLEKGIVLSDNLFTEIEK